MTEEKYNTKDIRHIDEKDQEYIAKGNRMTKELINSDGSRNWEANILLDNIHRLEQENKELRQQLLEDKILDEHIENLSREDNYRSALEEIRKILNKECGVISNAKAVGIINEVLG